MRSKQENEQRQRDTFMANLLDKSNLLKQKAVKQVKQQPRECLTELELSVNKIMELKPPLQTQSSQPDSVCSELQDHLLDIYTRIVIPTVKLLV